MTEAIFEQIVITSSHDINEHRIMRQYGQMLIIVENNRDLKMISLLLNQTILSNNSIKHVDVCQTRGRKNGDIVSKNNIKTIDKRTFSVHSFDYHSDLSELFSPFTR